MRSFMIIYGKQEVVSLIKRTTSSSDPAQIYQISVSPWSQPHRSVNVCIEQIYNTWKKIVVIANRNDFLLNIQS